MYSEIGLFALKLSLILAIYGAIGSFVGHFKKNPQLVLSARYALFSVVFLLTISTISLVVGFVSQDFSLRYVYENSNLSMPVEYTWVAFYAGNAGSLLFIAMVYSILIAVTLITVVRAYRNLAASVAGILGVVLVFFLGVIVFLANPLEKLDYIPPDGLGINPLLIHFGMFIHPPMQMTGLISVVIPFSLILASALVGKPYPFKWLSLVRIWALISWVILTLGLMLGSWWAYTILGWGGYWAWDPVENSALMPWFGMTALVHSLVVEMRRGIFRLWNVILATIAFSLASVGMFINRGGPVPSVHSFAESSLGWVFLIFLGCVLFISSMIIIWREDVLRSHHRMGSYFSREAAFLLQNILFLVVTFITLWGTIYPVISDVFFGEIVSVGEPYYNRVNGPVLLIIVALMGIAPVLPWGQARLAILKKRLLIPALSSLGMVILLLILGLTQVVPIIAFAVLTFIVGTILDELVRGTISRIKRGENYIASFWNLINSNRTRYGGFIVHMGIVILAVGATGSSFYSVQKDFVFEVGETKNLGRYSFTYDNLERKAFLDRQEITSEFSVYLKDKFIANINTTRAFYPQFDLTSSKAGIVSTLAEDFYIVSSGLNNDEQAVFRVYINPLVKWMWLSGPIILLGTIVAILGAFFQVRRKNI